MLSQDDRRELDLIAQRLRTEDPQFADALAKGKPRSPSGDRRWPFIAVGIAAGLLFFAGLVSQSISMLILAVGVAGCVALLYWRHVVRSQRPEGPPPPPSGSCGGSHRPDPGVS